MSDMFGAPIGIGQAEADQRQVIQGALQAQKTLGEIELQPATKKMTEAHAELYAQEAQAKLQANEQQAQIGKLATQFSKEEAQAAIQAAAAQGKVATWNDISVGGKPPANSPTARQERWIKFLEANNAPESILAPLRKELATETQHYAAAKHAEAQAEEQRTLARGKQMEQRSRAVAAVLADPSQYPAFLAAALASPDPEVQTFASKLPPKFTPAVGRLLNQVRLQGIETQKQAELELEKRRTDATVAAQGAQVRVADAKIGVMKQRARLIKDQADLAEKFGGANAQATLDKRQVDTAAKKALVDAKLAKQFPPLPLDGKYLRDQGYNINGEYYYYIGKGADGVARFKPAAKMHLEKARAAAADASGEDDFEDTSK